MHSTSVFQTTSRIPGCILKPKYSGSAAITGRQAVVCNWTRGGGRGGYLTPLGPVIQQHAGTGGSMHLDQQQQQQRVLSAEGDAGASSQMSKPHSTSTSPVGKAVKAAKELGKAAKQALQQQ